jgi:hypothetical protein
MSHLLHGMRNIPTTLVQTGSGQGRIAPALLGRSIFRECCFHAGGLAERRFHIHTPCPRRKYEGSLRRAGLGAMPEAMLPHSVGGGLREAGDTGAGKGWSAAQRRRRSGGTPQLSSAKMTADGMQSSARRRTRLLVPQSTDGPPTATPTRLCEIAPRSSDFRHAKPRIVWPKGVARSDLSTQLCHKTPGEGIVTPCGPRHFGGSGGAQRNESPVSFS